MWLPRPQHLDFDDEQASRGEPIEHAPEDSDRVGNVLQHVEGRDDIVAS